LTLKNIAGPGQPLKSYFFPFCPDNKLSLELNTRTHEEVEISQEMSLANLLVHVAFVGGMHDASPDI
jgi:hypothetical protein